MWILTRSDTNQAVQLFVFRKKRYCTIQVAKTKALISFFVFAYTDCWFSHDAAHLLLGWGRGAGK